MEQSIQEQYAAQSRCFGCGPSNPKGLRIRSFQQGEELVATWHPEAHHEAFPGMMNGGIVGALLDCHANWTAACALMKVREADAPPCTVTAEFRVKLKRPTPMEGALQLRARVVEVSDPRVVVEGELWSGEKVTATVWGLFVAVEEGHPAFHRW
ncbi:MAG: thioesterase [Deltaproteobacteria bacterium]|nr:thioesterase [Deltaproteobacteria bacterium]HCH66415.1 PaaI family thioesterase [Deltaproteobacteria bacterium]